MESGDITCWLWMSVIEEKLKNEHGKAIRSHVDDFQ